MSTKEDKWIDQTRIMEIIKKHTTQNQLHFRKETVKLSMPMGILSQIATMGGINKPICSLQEQEWIISFKTGQGWPRLSLQQFNRRGYILLHPHPQTTKFNSIPHSW
jgi:hypothetical protein